RADLPPRVGPQPWFLDRASKAANRHWAQIFVDGGPISEEAVDSHFLRKAVAVSAAVLHLLDHPSRCVATCTGPCTVPSRNHQRSARQRLAAYTTGWENRPGFL